MLVIYKVADSTALDACARVQVSFLRSLPGMLVVGSKEPDLIQVILYVQDAILTYVQFYIHHAANLLRTSRLVMSLPSPLVNSSFVNA
jgi:hypothetical protein